MAGVLITCGKAKAGFVSSPMGEPCSGGAHSPSLWGSSPERRTGTVGTDHGTKQSYPVAPLKIQTRAGNQEWRPLLSAGWTHSCFPALLLFCCYGH